MSNRITRHGAFYHVYKNGRMFITGDGRKALEFAAL